MTAGPTSRRICLLTIWLAAALPACAGSEPELNQGLRRKLLEMGDADQAQRTGQGESVGSDDERTQRLKEIIEEFGWPTPDLVGRDGASAAWLIAQHSDFDVEFQERALELMREALESGDADPTEVAYLEDRVAVNRDRPQAYGTQIRCMEGRPEPATRVEDAESVDERRARVGLAPLDDYYAELEEACAAEAAGTP